MSWFINAALSSRKAVVAENSKVLEVMCPDAGDRMMACSDVRMSFYKKRGNT